MSQLSWPSQCGDHDAAAQRARTSFHASLPLLRILKVGMLREENHGSFTAESCRVDHNGNREAAEVNVDLVHGLVALCRRLPEMDLQISFHPGYQPATRLRFLSGVGWCSPDALYRRAGLAPGMRCLDVRCGTGQATLPMARMAGSDGRVVGIDPEERFLDQARHEAARQGLNVEFRVGDVADLHDRGTYDLVYTRYLLSGSSKVEAERTLKQMIGVVHPGGTIVVEDLDCSFDGDGSPMDHPAYTRFLELFNALIKGGEAAPPRRQQLPQLLERAGVAGVQCSEAPSAVLSRGGARNPASLMLASIRNAVVAAQLATRGEVDRLAAELDRFRIEPQCSFGLPRIVQVWGSVPTLGSGL